MSTAKSLSKKRKRDTAASPNIIVKLSEPLEGPVGPLLVSYPAIHPHPSTAFQCYARKKTKTTAQKEGNKVEKEEVLGPKDILVVGEGEDIEFISNGDESQAVADAGCRYLIAAFSRRTSTLNILPTPKSPYVVQRTVKALKSIPSAPAPSALQYREAKTALGETFGTKKAKANIRAQERNRVDVSAMEGVVGHLMEGIDKGAVGLMTHDEAKTAADNNRLVPPFSSDATDPAEIYPLHDIIPDVEWKTLSLSAIEQASTGRERIAMLPFKWSAWINGHLNGTRDETRKEKKKNMKILLYISAMLAFRQVMERNKKGIDKDKMIEKLSSVPGIVIDSLLSRFTEVARDSTSHVVTSATETKLLTYAFALCLKVDGYATDTSMLANDLSMSIQQVNQLFKTLGCKITVITDRERTRLGLPDSAARTKRAVLNAPVSFPRPRTLKRRT
ncbi:RNA polymerase I associated factor, A49-like protein [Collybia nuda]|uniref:RNA polymerase I associated factor, A49-like protein n=1 Tax=Collybia nuda TaxID=64659 RepID=A0A9P5YGR9_9AGAR|nr:RNA polymerase I associated factor, A49-like protein [Collybia nuda]